MPRVARQEHIWYKVGTSYLTVGRGVWEGVGEVSFFLGRWGGGAWGSHVVQLPANEDPRASVGPEKSRDGHHFMLQVSANNHTEAHSRPINKSMNSMSVHKQVGSYFFDVKNTGKGTSLFLPPFEG